MTKEQKIKLIDKWIKAGIRIRDATKKISDALGVKPESPIYTEPLHLLDEYTSALAEIIGDTESDWLEWFAHECDFGRSAMEMIFSNGEVLIVIGASDLFAAIDTDERGNRKWKP